MTGDLEARLRAALSHRARRAQPEPDLDAVLSGRSRLAVTPTRPADRPDRRRAVAWLAAAAVATLVAGTAWFVQNDSGPTTLRTGADPDTPRTCAVFLYPGTSDADAAAIGGLLTATPGVSRLQYLTQEDAHREFATLFADKPELVASVPRAVLPPSWRFDADLASADAAADVADALRSNPNVFDTRCGTTADELAGTRIDSDRAGTSGTPITGTGASTGEPGR
jgi:hypothetical protein